MVELGMARVVLAMLAIHAADSYLFEPYVLRAKLRAAWAGIICARQELQTERISMEEDSAIIIGWFWDVTKQLEAHPLLHDI